MRCPSREGRRRSRRAECAAALAAQYCQRGAVLLQCFPIAFAIENKDGELPMNDTLKSHIRTQSRLNFVINLVLNGAIAWFLLKDKPALTAWGEHGYGADLMITGFLLAALIAVFTMKAHRAKLARGEHESVPPAALGALACVATRSDWSNSLLFGLAGTLVGVGTVGMLMLLPLPPFSPLAYAVFKGVWAGILAALIVPPAIKLGLRAA